MGPIAGAAIGAARGRLPEGGGFEALYNALKRVETGWGNRVGMGKGWGGRGTTAEAGGLIASKAVETA